MKNVFTHEDSNTWQNAITRINLVQMFVKITTWNISGLSAAEGVRRYLISL